MNISASIKRISDSSVISVLPQTFTVEAIGGEYELEIICDTSWVITSSPDYVDISPIRGFSNNIVRLTFEKNDDLINNRTGEIIFKDGFNNEFSVQFSQNPAELTYEYTFSADSLLNFINTGDTKPANLRSYKTSYLWDNVYEDNIALGCTVVTSDYWITANSNNVTCSENTIDSQRIGTVTLTQAESGKTITINVIQDPAVYTYKYFINEVENISVSAASNTTSVPLTMAAERYINGKASGTKYSVSSFSVQNNNSFITTSSNDSELSVSISNNTVENSRSGDITITPSTPYIPVEGTLPTTTFSVNQSAGEKVYSDITASLSYSASAAASGGTCSPTISYSQSYTWNGVSGSGGSVSSSDLSVVYSLSETEGASINTSSGAVTWSNNKSLSTRTSNNITATITGLGGKTKTVTATCSQNAGYYTYSDITINTFAYSAVSAVGGTSSPSITYSQPYGWNGETSGAGTVNGNGDDSYTTYKVSTAQTGLSVASDTGIITWAKNNPTSGVVDPARSGVITATVIRNNKTATKAVTVTQNAETISSYGAWSFSLVPNTTSIAATGGTVTLTLSRPTRTVTYDTGDTQTETATAGTFAITRSNSSFTLSTTSVSMTSSSLPTFTLSVGATGATTASAISSTVTAAFTASNPTTGTTTASKTSSSITRAASAVTATNYRFSTFSLAKTSFTAAAGSTTLSMVVQRKYTYTGNQEGSWTTITPSSGTLSVTAGTGGSVGTITYGSTSTCTISVAAYTSTSANRSISISGNYNSGSATSSATITQTKDAISSYGAVSVTSHGSASDIPAKGGSVTASGGKGSQTITYVSGATRAGTVTCGTYSTVSANPLGTTTTTARTHIGNSTATLTGEGSKTATVSVAVYQAINSRSVTSVYIVPYQPDSSWITTTSGSGTSAVWNTVPASGGYLKAYGYYTYTYTSGSTKDEQQTADASLTFSGSPSWITKHTNGGYYVANRTTTTGDARSTTATWTSGGKTSSGKTVTQAANAITNSSYNASTSWNTPSISIGSGITAAGGSATVSHSQSGTTTYYYYYTSGRTSGPYTKSATGSTSIKITTNGNSRFSLSGNTLSHSSMTTNTTTDTCVITVTGSGSKTNTSSVSVTNSSSSEIVSWGTPVITSKSGSLSPSGGTFEMYTSVTDTYRTKYTSGSYSSNWTTAGTCNIGKSTDGDTGTTNSKYGVVQSNTGNYIKITGTNMGTTEATVKFFLCVKNPNKGGSCQGVDVWFEYTNKKTSTAVYDGTVTFGFPSCTVTSFGASGGTGTLSCSCTQAGRYKYTYTSGSESYSDYTLSTSRTPSFKSNVSWATISGSTLTVAANTGSARSGSIQAYYGNTNSNGLLISQSGGNEVIMSVESLRTQFESSSIFLNYNKQFVSISVNGSATFVTFHGLWELAYNIYAVGSNAFIDFTSTNNIDVSVSDVGVEWMYLTTDVMSNMKHWRLYFTVPPETEVNLWLFQMFTVYIYDYDAESTQQVTISFEE